MTTHDRDKIIAAAKEACKEDDLTNELLEAIFDYDDGVLLWKTPLNRRIIVGSIAGTIDGGGYVQVMISRKKYKAHRIIYKMFAGSCPKELDHINGNPSDNRYENLRPATRNENARNCRRPKTNTTGVKNVHWHAGHKKWQVSITTKNKQKHIGYFSSLEEAETAAKQAREAHHGEFAKHE